MPSPPEPAPPADPSPRGIGRPPREPVRGLRPDLPPPASPAWPALTTTELLARKPVEADYAALPRAPIAVVLDDVRSLANVGLIFRLCDAARVEHLYLCGITGHPLLPDPAADPRSRDIQERAEREITKTAVMAVPFVPWSYCSSAEAVALRLRDSGYQIVAVEQAHGSVAYTTPGLYRPPLALVLGHERVGISPLTLRLADALVDIPIYGMANSLNVAMATGLVTFEVLRQHDAFQLSPL